MKKFRFAIILTFNFIFMSFAYSQNLAQAVLDCDFPTVEKYVEKLGADLNKPVLQCIGNVENPSYLFLTICDKNQEADIEKRKMANYLIEHGAKIDKNSLFYVLEWQDYEMLYVFYNQGKLGKNLTFTLGNLDTKHTPINTLANTFGSLFNSNLEKEKKELSQKQWTLLDYYQSPLLHKWYSSYLYNAGRDYYNGYYLAEGLGWLFYDSTKAFYTLELLARISETADYENCNHTLWLIAEDLEHTKQYLRDGGDFCEVDYMAMNLLKNEELISFLKDLDFYKPCNIKTEELGEFSIWVLRNFFADKIDGDTINFLNAVYLEGSNGVSEETTEIIKNAVNGGIDLNKALDNFSEKTPLYFAKKYCSSETLEKYFGNETEKSE